MIDVKMKLHLCKEPDKFQFVVLAHNIGWQIYWLFSDDQRIKSIEGQVTEAGASGSDYTGLVRVVIQDFSKTIVVQFVFEVVG